MVKGLYHYIKQAWRKPDKETLRQRMIDWRKSNSIVTVDKPLRLDRARELGYKDKKGFVVARVRLIRGGHKRTKPKKGRRTKRQTVRKTLKMNYKWIAEGRAEKKFKNLEVLNSYIIGKDGIHYFYEVILIDPERKEIQKDDNVNWLAKPKNQKRAARGLTSSAKKARGLRSKSTQKRIAPSRVVRGRKGK